MSDPENIFARWSRLKSRAAKQDAKPKVQAPAAPPEDAARYISDPASTEPNVREAGEFDIANLPPIESITSESDIRAFLRAGVPAHLTRAALRRVWTTDPAIRDFIGIAENQWDFTDPNAVPGFGPLHVTDDVRKLVEQ